MAILSKERKPDNFQLHNFLKFSFTNIGVLHSIFVDCKLFLESNSPDILALCETNLNGSIDSGKLFVRGNLPLFWNDSTTHVLGLAVYVKEGLPFTWDLLQILIFLTGFTSLSSVSYYSFVYQSPSLSLCTDFYSVSSNIDEVLSINPSANVFVFGDFPTQIPDCDTHIAAVLDLFISSELVFVLQWLSLHWKILIILLCQFPLTFHQILNGMTCFTA